jgi:PAS domain S-box-containing protein
MNDLINVLFVEDSEDDTQLALRALRQGGFSVEWQRVETPVAIHGALSSRLWDAIISDYNLPKIQAPEVLEIVKKTQLDIPFIVVSGTIGEASAVELMKKGANDYIMKGDLTRFAEAVRREVREAQIRAEKTNAIIELDQTKERLQLAIEGSGIGLWDWLVQTGELTINDRWAGIIGHSIEELAPICYETWELFTHPEDLQKAKLALEKHFRKETLNYEIEIRMRHKLGAWVWVLSRGKVVEWDASDRPLRLIGTHLDISGRKQSVEMLINLNQTLEERVQQRTAALQISEATNRVILESIPDLLLRLRRDGICLDYIKPNLKSENLLPIVNHISDVLPPHLLESQLQMIERAIVTKELQIYEYECLKLDRTVYAEIRILAINDEEVLLILRDISDRKQTELKLQQQANLDRLLGSITQRMRASLNLGDILKVTVEEVHQYLQADRVLIYRIYPEGSGEAVAESVSPKWIQILNIVYPEEVFPDVNHERYVQGRIYTLSDREDPSQDVLPCLLEFLTKIQVRAKIVVPIVQNQTLWGLLIAHQCDRPRHWQDLEIDLLKKIAIQLAIAIQQAELYHQLQYELQERQQAEKVIRQQAEKESLLREITQRIGQSLDLQTIFDAAVGEVRKFLKADRVGIFKFYPESNFDDGEIVAESLVEGFTSALGIRVHDHTFGDNYAALYAKGRYFIAEDIYSIAKECHIDILAKFQVRSNMVIPLLRGDRLWGLLCIHQCETTRKWQQSEIDFSQQITAQLAIAIQQVSLFEQLQQELQVRQQAEADLTESNQKLAISNDELICATRLKDEFLANMSHELRTPLNAILGMTEAMQEGVFGTVTARQIKALQTVESSGTHLLELINDILDVAKIESGKVTLELTDTEMDLLCQSSMTFIRQQAMRKNIQLIEKIPFNLPTMMLDERRMRQVLINLLNNAVKFTPENKSITLEVALRDNYLRIAVIDTGIGIASENIPKLFQPFIQIDSALNRQYVGTGLGLVLVKRIVELHNGQVELTSEIGVGSSFVLNIPYNPASSPPSGASLITESTLETISPDHPSLATRSPLILLADDSEANVSTISCYLEAKGYRIVVAKDGAEAIALAQDHHPDLILMDIQMPIIDGLKATEQIRLNPQLVNTPIIALTGLAMIGDREKCLNAGANEYLTKPVKLKFLFQLIQNLLAT